MVVRQVKIDRRLLTMKQGKKGTFDVLSFEEHGMDLGSLTMELALFLSKTLHDASDFGTNGKNYWSSSDMMYWMKIHKRSNMFGAIMQVTWARKLKNSRKMLMEIPGSTGLIGWKRFAISLDSLNPSARNWGEDVFPCAFFAGRSRAYNDLHNRPNTTMVDALGQLDTFGEWRHGIVCNRPTSVISWHELGTYLFKTFKLTVPLEILPIDDLKAVLCTIDTVGLKELLNRKEISYNNWNISFLPWSPHIHKQPLLSSNGIFWLSLLGVPLNFWTPEIIRNLCNHCGELLKIDESSLALEDVSSIKIKIRNDEGPNSIPRVLNLQTPEGDFEVQVNIISTGKSLSDPIHGKVLITEIGDMSAGELDGEEDELDLVVVDKANVDLSEETISDNLTHKEVCRQRKLKNALIPSPRYASDNNARGSFHSGDSYTTLTCPRLHTRRKRHAHGNNRLKQKKKRNYFAKRQWMWVPKALSVPSHNINLGVENSSTNSNLNLCSLPTIVPQHSHNGAQSTVPLASEDCASSSVPQNNTSSDTESSFVPCTQTDNTSSQNIKALAFRRLQIGLELGMSFANQETQALALMERNIRRDVKAIEIFKSKHKNPDLLLSQGDLVVEEDTDSEPEEAVRSTITPLAPFIDPIDAWNNSFLQDEFSYDSSNVSISISVPPGFSNVNSCSLRSLKSSLKNHYKSKEILHTSIVAGTSKRGGKS